MGIINWLATRLGHKGTAVKFEDFWADYATELHIREIAFWSCVNIVGNAISKCSFKTYLNGKLVEKEEHYLWNVQPNRNQNSSEFMHNIIAKLYANNECLVIENNGELFVADSFNKDPYAFYEDKFTDIEIKGLKLDKVYRQSEVLYFKLAENDMRRVINAFYDTYIKLITHSMDAYKKSRGIRGVFEYDTLPAAGTDDEEVFNDLVNNKFKQFLNSANSILPLGKGHKYTELGSKTYSNDSTRDIRAMIDDISDFTAKAFNIPPALLRGDIQGTKDALDQFLTFCIDPLVDMMQEEINRKRVGMKDYIKGTKVVIDTSTIKHIDLLEVTASIDKLVSSGCFTINDIRKILGMEPINEEWANQVFITKNYATVEELLKSIERGN